MRTIFALCTAALLAACTTVTTPAPREGPVALGEEAFTGGPLVRPLEALEDSRCPINVRCVWAGRLVVRVAIRGHQGDGSWTEQRDLELGRPQDIADGTITLVRATPDRIAGKQTDRRDYRFTFEFTGGL